MPYAAFLSKIDSGRGLLTSVLDRHRHQLDAAFIRQQQLEINYYFDRLLIEYPDLNAVYTGTNFSTHPLILAHLKHDLPDFNQPDLLKSSDFTDYVRSFFA